MNTTTPPYTRKPSIGAPDVEICDPAIGSYRDPHVCFICGREDPEHWVAGALGTFKDPEY